MRAIRLTISNSSDRVEHSSAPLRQQPSLQAHAIPVTRSTILKSGLLLGAAALSWTPSLSSSAAVPAFESATTAARRVIDQKTLSQVVLTTLSDCQLAVSIYPTFGYNAGGGGGTGSVTEDPETGLIRVKFDPESLNIPAIDYKSSTVLGVPIPPPLRIAIKPQKLEGTIDPTTGKAELDFLAGFEFTAGPLYTAPPLVVSTTLTTEESSGPLRSGKGKKLSADGRARLVGVARVPKTGDGFLDGFLMLPTDALAVLSADLQFS